MFCEGLEVLRGGDEMAFVSCTGDAPQAHTLEAMVGLSVIECFETDSGVNYRSDRLI